MNRIRYSIATRQDNWGEKKWQFVIRKYVRVVFKRSKREGWRWMGYVYTGYTGPGFNTRAEALAYARLVREAILNRGTPQL